MRNTGERIKFFRNKRGMSQATLASLVGVDRSHIAKLETGETVGSVPVIRKIASALGVSVSDLLDELDEEEKSA